MWSKVNSIFRSLQQKQARILPYTAIGVTVFIFNLIAVFGLKNLLHDDPAGYYEVLRGEGFHRNMLEHNLIAPFTGWASRTVMTFSPQSARALYILVLMIPIACCLYYLYHAKFGFSPVAAYAAAVVPLILPRQHEIPTGISDSYILWGFLFVLLSMLLSFRYLDTDSHRKWSFLLAAAGFYLISTQFMELALFMFPPLALAVLGFRKQRRERILLFSAFLLVALTKVTQVLLSPRKKIFSVAVIDTIGRIGKFFDNSLAFPPLKTGYTVSIVVIIIGAAFFLCARKGSSTAGGRHIFSHFTKGMAAVAFYGFFLCWVISTIFFFLVMTPNFPSRYSFISSFGLNAVFLFSLSVLLAGLFPGKKRVVTFILLGSVAITGIYRFFSLKNSYVKLNSLHTIIERQLGSKKLPPDSQAVIVLPPNFGFFAGGWKRSSGFLEFALKRKDVTGLIGKKDSSVYYNFDSHFDPRVRAFLPRFDMTGLDFGKPVFLFLCDLEQAKLIQLQYALQWLGESKDAVWKILKADKNNGRMSVMTAGFGMQDYMRTVKKMGSAGIRQTDILWGGPPTNAERQRLRLGEN